MGGGSKYYGIINWPQPPPPPPKNIQEQYFANGIQLQLSFKTQNIYISQTILLGGWHFFLMGCGGVYILWYNILTPPPPHSQKYSRIVFVHEIQWQLSFNTQNIYISQTILIHGWHFFFMGWGGGVNILWYNILTPPLPLNDIKERQLQSRIQLSFRPFIDLWWHNINVDRSN